MHAWGYAPWCPVPGYIVLALCIKQASGSGVPGARARLHTHACTQALEELLESDAKYGFIVMDGNGSLFGTLSGNTREVLHKFTVDLPKKHGRGGQSALRFARLRLEKRHNYVRKVAETSVQMFITDGQRPNVAGLVVAGSAEFKDKLIDSEMFDPRLKAIILCVVDVSYGAAPSQPNLPWTLHWTVTGILALPATAAVRMSAFPVGWRNGWAVPGWGSLSQGLGDSASVP